ncbi:MAG: hypothetical protein AB1351_13510 [Thermoproteota archaeon]
MHSKECEEGYWFNELDSLGIHPKKKNELNDKKEMEDLVENVKQTMLQEYRSAYE